MNTPNLGYGFRLGGNTKTGPIPITYAPQAGCPDRCTLKGNGCYAENAPVVWHWKKLETTGMSQEEMLWRVSRLPRGQKYRHHVAGDFVDPEVSIPKYIAANRGKKGMTYTHHDPWPIIDLLREANDSGLTINMSANDMQEAAFYHRGLKLPTTVVLPRGFDLKRTDSDIPIITCPAVLHEHVTCAACQLCWQVDRDFLVGFPAHGTRAKTAEKVFFRES